MCCLLVEVHPSASGDKPELSCASIKLLDVSEDMDSPTPRGDLVAKIGEALAEHGDIFQHGEGFIDDATLIMNGTITHLPQTAHWYGEYHVKQTFKPHQNDAAENMGKFRRQYMRNVSVPCPLYQISVAAALDACHCYHHLIEHLRYAAKSAYKQWWVQRCLDRSADQLFAQALHQNTGLGMIDRN